MSRKIFIESLGATCKNWNWSWSFINEEEKKIIFGAWDIHDNGKMSLILSEDWMVGGKGRKSTGYPQSREHVRLIEEEGYQLLIFPMKHSAENQDDNGSGPAKISDFEETLFEKELVRIHNGWYATTRNQIDKTQIPEELGVQEEYKEGASRTIQINAYERNSAARAACLAHFGYKCSVCNFDFENMYGKIGENYIHVHHVVPISTIKKEYALNPVEDLIPVCPNCHAMIHSTVPALSIDALKTQIRSTGCLK